MKILIRILKTVIKFFGYKISVNRIVRRKNYNLFFSRDSLRKQKNLSAIIYLDIGDDTEEFVLNSITSFRKFDIDTTILVYVIDSNKKTKYLSYDLDIQIKEIDSDFKSNISNYSDFGTKEFNKITNLKWNIILSTFNLGYDTVIYTDFDVVFLDSPLNYIIKSHTYFDIMIQSESQKIFPPIYCTGFMVFNVSSLPILKELEIIGRSFEYNDQELLNRYLFDIPDVFKLVHILPESIFPNGLHWKNLINNKKIESLELIGSSVNPILFHANFLAGLKQKKIMLNQLELWYINDKVEQ
jgi:hypothetical protein